MSLFTIDRDRCNQDGLCAAECPARVIQMDPAEGWPGPVPEAEEFCIACGHCVAVCPTGALSLSWLKPEDCPPVRTELALSAEQAEQFLRSRRSIRTFQDRPVERDKITKLLEITCGAPSAKNSQFWHWLIIEDPAQVRRLTGLVIDWMRAETERNPAQARERGFPRVLAAWKDGDERICRGAPCLILVHGDKTWGYGAEDAALALGYLELFAPVLGLGACWGGYFYTATNSYPPLSEALGLPEEHRAFGAMMLGYPKFKYQRLPRRNSPRVTWR